LRRRRRAGQLSAAAAVSTFRRRAGAAWRGAHLYMESNASHRLTTVEQSLAQKADKEEVRQISSNLYYKLI